MAFHVACPITCRKICFCALGFPGKLRSEKGKIDFLEEVARVEQFLNDPWLIKARENATIQVKVPKVVVVTPPPAPQFTGAGRDEAAKIAAASSQVKRAVLQKQLAKESLGAEDFARRFESCDLVDSVKDVTEEEQGNSNVKVTCRLCFSGENEGSERARKMLSCNTCGKKYHRHCLKSWSRNRDLFHWSSWSCPSCRSCEVCRRTGDPSKFMFCKRCDGAYHCYCQQPPHKNVGHSPYLCPKHTKCHSCGSSVPGNGSSTRWFLGYTCCDACGRLFVKGNYCPVCLKVYRDSESTPMVCCDICQRWVHCPCDGISDAKYMQFQVDGNLQYVCPMCRGECTQVRSIEEAVQELWRRRDEADKDLITSLRAAAGLPTQDEIFDISPFSDDEESEPLIKTENRHSFKFPLKGLGDRSPKKGKEHGKKSSKIYKKKKGNEISLIGAADGDPLRYNTGNTKKEIHFSGAAEGITSANEAVVSKHKSSGDGMTPINVTKASRTIRIKSNKSHGSTNSEETGMNPKATTRPKLVIHLGGRGPEDTNQSKPHECKPDSIAKFGDQRGNKPDQGSNVRGKGGLFMKLKNANSDDSGGEYATDGYESVSPKKGKRGIKESTFSGRESEALPKEQRTHLKFKIPRNSSSMNRNAAGNLTTLSHPPGKDEVPYTRGHRSKRKRPAAVGDEDTSQLQEDNTVRDLSDANWILLKLGKGAAGKRVEIHQPSDDSWHRGTVVEVMKGTSMVSIALDEGKTKSYELGKQGIRFVSQKQKH